MNDPKQMQQLMQLQQEAAKIKRELKNTHIEAEEGDATITINGEQEIVTISIKPEASNNLSKLETDLVTAFNKGIKKSQEIGAEKMKEVMGSMGLDFPGLS
jgi:nucleoid-associated protein EbfC